VKYRVSDSAIFRFKLIILVVIVLTIIFIISEAANAYSQSRSCGKRDIMVEMLNKTHGEAIVMAAHNNGNQSMLEFFGRSDGTTWTILITYKNGLTCVTAIGDWWMSSEDAGVTKAN